MTVLTRISSLNQTSSQIKQSILIKHHILITSTDYSIMIQLIDITIQTLSIFNYKHFQ